MFSQLFPFGMCYVVSCSRNTLKMMASSQRIFSLANTQHWENWLEMLSQTGELACSSFVFFSFFFLIVFQKHLTVGWESLWAIKTAKKCAELLQNIMCQKERLDLLKSDPVVLNVGEWDAAEEQILWPLCHN